MTNNCNSDIIVIVEIARAKYIYDIKKKLL